jgi:hypothetical protein
MDQTNGTQPSASLLPSVETLEPGLVLLFKHPNVDRRYILQHISDMDKYYGQTRLYPSFQEKDLSTGPLDEALAKLKKLRDDARAAGRVYFILTPAFAPRMGALSEMAGTVVHYQTGINCATLFVTKVNGLVHDQPSPKHIGMIVRRPTPDRMEPLDTSEGITITVSGKVHSGRSAVSAVIMNALQDKWPHIKIDWQDPDGEHAKQIVQSNLVEGHYDSIGAKSFLITNETKAKSQVNA